MTLVATLDETGRVAEIRKAREPLVMSSQTPPPNPTALRIAAEAFVRDAAAALRRWQYEQPASAPISFTVSFAFKPGAEAVATQNTRRDRRDTDCSGLCVASGTAVSAAASRNSTAGPRRRQHQGADADQQGPARLSRRSARGAPVRVS